MEFSTGYKIVAYGVVPIMFIIGFFGNALSIAVFSNRALAFRTSTVAYLLYIAVVSLNYVILYIPFIVKEFAYGGTELYKWIMISYQCYIGYYGLQVLGQAGTWATATVAVERCIVVGMPNKRKILCQRRVSWCICGGITVASALMNIPALFRCRPVTRRDYSRPKNYSVGMDIVNLPGYVIDKAELANIILSTINPFIIILVSNIIFVMLTAKNWKKMVQSTANNNDETAESDILILSKRDITAMVLSHTSLYLISHLLSMYVYIRVGFEGMDYYYTAMDEAIGFYSNSMSMAFFCFSASLYLCISPLFRRKAIRLFFRHKPRSSQMPPSTESHRPVSTDNIPNTANEEEKSNP